MSDDPYLYPGTNVLRNKLGIRDEARLETVERRLTTDRIAEGCPEGDFDLAHLAAIHKHIFQDIFDWAGQTRTVDIAKGGSAFQPSRYIETGMSDVHRRLERDDYLRGLSADEFADKAGVIMGDINHTHPFREGNGRTQLQYLSQLAEQAGHPVDLTKLDQESWLHASIRSHKGDYEPMQDAIRNALADREAARNDTKDHGSDQSKKAVEPDLGSEITDSKQARIAKLRASFAESDREADEKASQNKPDKSRGRD